MYQRKFVVEWPITEHGVEIGMADARVEDFDEGFANFEVLGLDSGHLLDIDGTALLVEDGGLVSLGDGCCSSHCPNSAKS